MVSDFIEEHNGYLCLTAELEAAMRNYPSYQARLYLEYGENKEPPRSL